MTGNDLPDDDHVVRYARPKGVYEDGRVDGSEFRLRPGEASLSVHWLECFRDLTKPRQLMEVRRLVRLDMSPNGRLAEINVGDTKRHLSDRLDILRFVRRPLDAEEPFEADPTHSEIEGLPPGDTEQAALIGDMIAECVQRIYPAVQETD